MMKDYFSSVKVDFSGVKVRDIDAKDDYKGA